MTGAARSPVPARLPEGQTTDWPWGPLADCGYGNPSQYHCFYDDFDDSLGATGLWTVSKGSTGTAAHIAGDGGLAQLTTAATLNDYVGIQLPAASFSIPQGALAGKKMFFLTRLQLSDVTNSAFVAGLINTTATLFGGGSITDGIYFQKASGGTVLNIITASGGVLSTTAIPAAYYSLANATNIDLAFYVDFYQNVNVFVSSQLFGYIPQSGGGGNATPNRGACLKIAAGSWTISAANLNVSMAVQAGAAAAKSITGDFIGALKER